MNDRELLELAAKAAGLTLTWGEVFSVGGDVVDCSDLPYSISDSTDEAPCYWNPLEDDGDAFRLAVKLGIAFRVIGNKTIAVGDTQCDEYSGEDQFASARRAIVRAAAELGKAK